MQPHFQLHNPHRPVDWRYTRALEIVSGRKRASRRWDDGVVFKATKFLRTFQHLTDDVDRDQLFHKDMGLFYAHAIYAENDEPDTRFVVEARLLAGQPDEEIAELISTLPSAITWYHDLFFDVRGRLLHRDYIVNTVLKEGLRRGVGSYDFTTKLFGYFGGVVALDHMLYGFRVNDKPTEVADLNNYYDRHQMTNLRRKAALETFGAEVNRFNVVELLALHVRLMEMERASQQKGNEQGDSLKAVDGLLANIQWVVGRKLLNESGLQGLDYFDANAAELRAGEMLEATYAKPKKRKKKLKQLSDLSGQFDNVHAMKETNSGEAQQG